MTRRTENGRVKGIVHRLMHERIIELAAMFKEHKAGTNESLKKILARFCIQEGVRMRTARRYLELLESSGLVEIYKGHKNWAYHKEEEPDWWPPI